MCVCVKHTITIRYLQECVLTNVQSVLYMRSIRMRGCVQHGDVWYVIQWCSTVLAASHEESLVPPPQQSCISKPAPRSYEQHMLRCLRPPAGGVLSSNKNVKQMFVKCSRNEFTCEYLRFLFTLMGRLRFPRGVAKVDKKKKNWM